MTQRIIKLKSVKLEKIIEIVNNLSSKSDEIYVKFEEPKEFKRERDEFINSLAEFVKFYFSSDEFIEESDLKECIFNALERFAENVELLSPLKKRLDPIYDWKLEAFDIKERNDEMTITVIFERSGYYIKFDVYLDKTEDVYSLKMDYIVPTEIFKKIENNSFFDIKEGDNEVILSTSCKKLLADKLYWKGLI